MQVPPAMLAKREGVFGNKFLAIDPTKIVDAIRTTGFFSMENALTPEFLDRIDQDVARNRFGFNLNQLAGVIADEQYYLVNMLAVSKAFCDYCTNPAVFAVARELLGPRYRLQSLRYYETYGGHHMQWHTDNKTDQGFAHNPGIIFIAYISDVADGEFEYVRGSHKWSGDSGFNDYPDALVENKYGKDIVGFKLPRGSVIIYDSYGIHRAKPVADKTFVRKSLFFQIDATLNNSEKIIVNTAYLDKLDEATRMFLGFGMPGDYAAFPQTGLESLPLTGDIGALLFKWLVMNVKKKIKQSFGLRTIISLRSRARSLARRWA